MEYNSSEELQRHSLGVFVGADAEKKEKNVTETKRLKGIIDAYIKKYSSTSSVRSEAKKNGRTNDYQLDLSADIVEILEKIKSELR